MQVSVELCVGLGVAGGVRDVSLFYRGNGSLRMKRWVD